MLLPWEGWYGSQLPDWQLAFAATTRTMSAAMDMAGGRRDTVDGEIRARRLVRRGP